MQSRLCAEPTCSTVIAFTAHGHWKRFCCKECKLKTRNRDLKRGAQLLRLARQWRGTKRSHIKGAKMPPGGLGRLTAAVDGYLREDREMREQALRVEIAGDFRGTTITTRDAA